MVACVSVCVNEDACASERRLLGERVEELAICRTIGDWTTLECAGGDFWAVIGSGGLLDAGVMGLENGVGVSCIRAQRA